MDPMLTVPEVAALVKLHPKTIRRYITRGELPAVKFGNTYRVTAKDAEALATPPQPKPAKPRNQRDSIRQMLKAL